MTQRGPNSRGWATPEQVEAAAPDWPDEFLECRDVGHHWRYIDAIHVNRNRLSASSGFYRVKHECARCTMIRTREMSEHGHVFATSYAYPAGYLAEGIGRIAGDAKGAVRLASVKRYGVTEVRGKAKDDDLPRFGATRKEIEG